MVRELPFYSVVELCAQRSLPSCPEILGGSAFTSSHCPFPAGGSSPAVAGSGSSGCCVQRAATPATASNCSRRHSEEVSSALARLHASLARRRHTSGSADAPSPPPSASRRLELVARVAQLSPQATKALCQLPRLRMGAASEGADRWTAAASSNNSCSPTSELSSPLRMPRRCATFSLHRTATNLSGRSSPPCARGVPAAAAGRGRATGNHGSSSRSSESSSVDAANRSERRAVAGATAMSGKVQGDPAMCAGRPMHVLVGRAVKSGPLLPWRGVEHGEGRGWGKRADSSRGLLCDRGDVGRGLGRSDGNGGATGALVCPPLALLSTFP